jgi:hypothetical protein
MIRTRTSSGDGFFRVFSGFSVTAFGLFLQRLRAFFGIFLHCTLYTVDKNQKCCYRFFNLADIAGDNAQEPAR